MDTPTPEATCQAPSPQAAAGVVLDEVLENISDAVTVFDRELRYLYLNPEAEKIIGRPAQELLGRAFTEVFPDLAGCRFAQSARRAIQDQRPARFEEYYPGYDVWAEVRLHPYPGGVTSYFSDITPRKRMQEARQRSDDRLSLALEAAQMGMWDWVLAEDQISWSEQMPELLKDREGRFDGTFAGFRALVHPEDRERVEMSVRQALSGHGEVDVVFRILGAGGEPRWILGRGRTFFDPDGEPVRMSGICLDVTERIRMEQQLRQSQKMEAIGRLAGGVAHDFNNMLAVISGYTSLLIQQDGEQEPPGRILQAIRQATERAADLTRQLLAFSRQQVLQPQVLDLNQEVSSLSRLLRRLIGEHIHLETRLSPGLPCIQADPGQLHQVVLNLVVNARDAMPGGGRLILTTERSASRPGGPDLPAEPFVCLAVTDTGCGMSRDVMSRIFEPFFTTKAEGMGTGLGLSTVYGIVSQSGGEIQVRSEIGQGSTFEIYLPVTNEAPAAPRADETAPARGWETILLAEDEPMLRQLIRDALKTYGYQVLEAASGEEALQLCAVATGKIHLLLADIVMPGMSGAELAKEFRRLHPGSRILYMTGYTDDAILPRGVPAEGAFLLRKPFTIKFLARKVREVLQAPSVPQG